MLKGILQHRVYCRTNQLRRGWLGQQHASSDFTAPYLPHRLPGDSARPMSNEWVSPDRPKAGRIVSARRQEKEHDLVSAQLEAGLLTHPQHAERRMLKRHRDLSIFSSRYDRSVIHAIRGAGSSDTVLDILAKVTAWSSLSTIVYEEALRSVAWFTVQERKRGLNTPSSEYSGILQLVLRKLNDALRHTDNGENWHPSRLWGILRAAGILLDNGSHVYDRKIVSEIMENLVTKLLESYRSPLGTAGDSSGKTWVRALDDLCNSNCNNARVLGELLEHLSSNSLVSESKSELKQLSRAMCYLLYQPKLYLCSSDGSVLDTTPAVRHCCSTASISGFPEVSLWDLPLSPYHLQGHVDTQQTKGTPLPKLRSFLTVYLQEFIHACQRDTVSMQELCSLLVFQKVLVTRIIESSLLDLSKEFLVESYHRLLRYQEKAFSQEVKRIGDSIMHAAKARASLIKEMNLSPFFLNGIAGRVFMQYWNLAKKGAKSKLSGSLLNQMAHALYLHRTVLGAEEVLPRLSFLMSNLEQLCFKSATNISLLTAWMVCCPRVTSDNLERLTYFEGKIVESLEAPSDHTLTEQLCQWRVITRTVAVELLFLRPFKDNALSDHDEYLRSLLQKQYTHWVSTCREYIETLLEGERNADRFAIALQPLGQPSSENLRIGSTDGLHILISSLVNAGAIWHIRESDSTREQFEEFRINFEQTLSYLSRRQMQWIVEQMDMYSLSNFILMFPVYAGSHSDNLFSFDRLGQDLQTISAAESIMHLTRLPSLAYQSRKAEIMKCLLDTHPVTTSDFSMESPVLCGLICCSRIAIMLTQRESNELPELHPALEGSLRHYCATFVRHGLHESLSSSEKIWYTWVLLELVEHMLSRDRSFLQELTYTSLLTLLGSFAKSMFIPSYSGVDSSFKSSEPVRHFSTNVKSTKYAKWRFKQQLRVREQVKNSAMQVFEDHVGEEESLSEAKLQENHSANTIWQDCDPVEEEPDSDYDSDEVELLLQRADAKYSGFTHNLRQKSEASGNIDLLQRWISLLLSLPSDEYHFTDYAHLSGRFCKLMSLIQGRYVNSPLPDDPVFSLQQAISASAELALVNLDDQIGDQAIEDVIFSLKTVAPGNELIKQGEELITATGVNNALPTMHEWLKSALQLLVRTGRHNKQ